MVTIEDTKIPLVEEDSEIDSDSSVYSSDSSSDVESVYDEQFEYPDVIEGASKIGHGPSNVHDEDIGGVSVNSASVLAAGALGCTAVSKKGSIVASLILAGLVSYAMYLLWNKIVDLRREINELERQIDMSLSDKDVEVISTQVLKDFIQKGSEVEEAAEEYTQSVSEMFETEIVEPEQEFIQEIRDIQDNQEIDPVLEDEGIIQDPVLEEGIVQEDIQEGIIQEDIQEGIIQEDIQEGIIQEDIQEGIIQEDIQEDPSLEESPKDSLEENPIPVPKKRGRPKKSY